MVLIFVVVTLLLNVIWFLYSREAGYYWPMWPMIGFALATVFSAIATFGPGARPITEARIDEEIRRMGGTPGPSA